MVLKQKRIAVLLPCSISQDSRAQRTAKTLSIDNKVDIYYIDNTTFDSQRLCFNNNVRLVPVPDSVNGIRKKLIQHSFFYLENTFLYDVVKNEQEKYDIIYCHDLPTLYPAIKLKKYYNCKLVYDTHEIYIETINQFFPRKATILKRLVFNSFIFLMRQVGRSFEKKAIKEADLLFTVNSSCLLELEKKYKFTHGYVIPNLPELRLLPLEKKLRINNKISSSKFIVLYQGILNEGRYLREIVASAKYLKEKILLVLIGNGQMKEKLINYTKQNNLSHKILFISHIPYSELFSYTIDANLGLMFNEHINLSKKLAFANKVTEYMACKIPVLLSDSPEYRILLKRENVGSFISDFSPKDIAIMINKLSENREALYRQGENGHKVYMSNMHWEKYESYFIGLINELL